MNIDTMKHGMIVCDKFGNEYEVLAVVRNDRIFEDGVKLKLKHGGGKGYSRSYRNVYHTSNDVSDNVIQISDLRPTSTSYRIKRWFKNLVYGVKKMLKEVVECVKN